MLNGRLYRAAFVPFLFALAIAAFSLTARAAAAHLDARPRRVRWRAGVRRTARAWPREFPDRRPGQQRRRAARARHIAGMLKGLGGTAGGGFSVHTHRFRAQTIDGERTLTTVIAQRPGSTSATPIVILAHRDPAARGAPAELSGTAALLELARVFAASETRRTIVLVSTSGGSGGDAGAADFAAHAPRTVRRGDRARRPRRACTTQAVRACPSPTASAQRPVQLQRTRRRRDHAGGGRRPGRAERARPARPPRVPARRRRTGRAQRRRPSRRARAGLAANADPRAAEAVSAERLEGFGRAVLSAVYALDAAPDVSHVAADRRARCSTR